jgi:transcriptional regulator with XRE-family HTH domain
MHTLTHHIKTQPEKSLATWATGFGISRPYLHALLAGSRNPSLEVAKRIAAATRGAVAAI